MDITAYDQALFAELRRVVGETATVHTYHDDDRSHSLSIADWREVPGPGLVTWSTVQVSRAPNVVGEADIRAELLAVGGADKPDLARALATAGFYIVKNGWPVAPGVVFMDMLSTYAGLSTHLQHFWMNPPFLWSALGEVEVEGGPPVHWLHAVPISESERRLLLDLGEDAFSERFEDADVLYYDLERTPII